MPYTIIAYSKFGDERGHVFHAENGRQVVGLMKTIMDNFKPAHVDVMCDEAFKEGIETGVI